MSNLESLRCLHGATFYLGGARYVCHCGQHSLPVSDNTYQPDHTSRSNSFSFSRQNDPAQSSRSSMFSLLDAVGYRTNSRVVVLILRTWMIMGELRVPQPRHILETMLVAEKGTFNSHDEDTTLLWTLRH